MRNVVEKFRIMEFGFTIFILESAGTYSAYPFNVYLFPTSDSGTDKSFTIDVGAINFHKEHNFDFNKWIYEGLDYVHAQSEPESTSSEVMKLNASNSMATGEEDCGYEYDSPTEQPDQDASMKTGSDS